MAEKTSLPPCVTSMGLFDWLKSGMARVNLDKRFEKIAPVGSGTMSKVWRARERNGGKVVALKVLDPIETKKLEARFVGMNRPAEGAVAVTLDHPRVVKTFEHGLTTTGEQFLVMEFVEGFGLSYHIESRDELWRRHWLRILVEIGEGLAYLHARKWILRDLCPKNLLVTNDGHIKLIDFGLAVPNTPPFRKPGNRTGTVNYMAPELIRRQPTDERIDIFSYAVTCFETLTRRRPWPTATSADELRSHLSQPPTELRSLLPKLDSEVADAVMRGLAPDPRDRWPSASEMTAVLRGCGDRLGLL